MTGHLYSVSRPYIPLLSGFRPAPDNIFRAEIPAAGPVKTVRFSVTAFPQFMSFQSAYSRYRYLWSIVPLHSETTRQRGL